MSTNCELRAGLLSVTGSIGVVAGKFAAGGLFEKYGVTADYVATHPTGSGSPLSLYHEWTP